MAQMSEKNIHIRFGRQFRQRPGRIGIGQVASIAHNALLQHPRIRTVFQHVYIMISFQHHHVGILQRRTNDVRNEANVSGYRAFIAAARQHKANRIGRIMRNRKRRNR